MPYRCCGHCAEDDPVYHRENPPDSHDAPCNTGPNGHCEVGDRWVKEGASDER